ncbi:MAG: KilA-N domain-containing protein [Mucinivorans sp.]
MSPIKKITVTDVEIAISQQFGREDYICLTDMIKDREGEDHIRNWMRGRNTIEFLGTWETINNPKFKGVEFDTFMNEAGANRFNMTPRKWIDATDAIGIISKAGRNGGTYAHKDIAFEFGSWISPTFKLYLIKEYQRLKEAENNPLQLQWNVNRILSKVNYQLHTDAIKTHIIPQSNHQQWQYAEEADLLNLAIWGCTAKEWQAANAAQASKGLNLRDVATISELIVLVNIEAHNAHLIKEGVVKQQRFDSLCKMAQEQLVALAKFDVGKNFRDLAVADFKKLK